MCKDIPKQIPREPVIPRVTEGYRFELVWPPFCLSVCLSVCQSLQFFPGCTTHVSQRLLIGSFSNFYSDSTYLEDVQRRTLEWKKNHKLSKLSNFENLWGLECIFDSMCTFVQAISQRFYLLILQILKLCSVVVLIEKKNGNCQNYRIMNI